MSEEKNRIDWKAESGNIYTHKKIICEQKEMWVTFLAGDYQAEHQLTNAAKKQLGCSIRKNE